MQAYDVFKELRDEIHTTVFATANENGLPETRVIDIMLYDKDGLYFITARGKRFYEQLIKTQYASVSGFKGKDTLSSVAISINGVVKELGDNFLERVFEENPYMAEIYPTMESRKALTVFKLYKGRGEYFDLSKKPIERYSFSFGNEQNIRCGYYINKNCISCEKCLAVCPQSCIDIKSSGAAIRQENCLHCGNCMNICPAGAVERR